MREPESSNPSTTKRPAPHQPARGTRPIDSSAAGDEQDLGAPDETTASAGEPSDRAIEPELIATNARLQVGAIVVLVALLIGFLAGRTGAPKEQDKPWSPKPQTLSLQQIAEERFATQVEKFYLSKGIPLGIRRAAVLPDSTLVLEISPPDADAPLTVWETLGRQERLDMLGFLSLLYTRTLLIEGVTPSGRLLHPPLILKYANHAVRLGERKADGSLHTYVSPFADQTEALVRMANDGARMNNMPPLALPDREGGSIDPVLRPGEATRQNLRLVPNR